MPRGIVKLDGKYFEWSTIVDAPITRAMTRAEFEAYHLEEYGRQGMDRLAERMARVDEKGTSFLDEPSAESAIWLNRAGLNETMLSRSQIIAYVNNPEAGLPLGIKPNSRFSFKDWLALDGRAPAGEPK